MESTVVQPEKVQPPTHPKDTRVDLFRWQKWMDGEGRLWIITNIWGYDRTGTRYGLNVEFLNVDAEQVQDATRAEFEEWVRVGTLKRVEGPILL